MKYEKVMEGLFCPEVKLPPQGFLLTHQRRRLTSLIMSVRRYLKAEGHKIVEEAILEAVVRITPAYGMDPALFFRFCYNGGLTPKERRLPEETSYGWKDDIGHRFDGGDPPNTWEDLGKVMISAVAGSAMLHRTLSEHGQYPSWDPNDWDAFVVMNASLHYLGLWINRVFANPVFIGDPDVIGPPTLNRAPVFGGPVNHTKLTTCKWKMGQLIINGTMLHRSSLRHFDLEACETCVCPPYNKVYRSFELDKPFKFYHITHDNPHGYDQQKVQLLRRRNRERLKMYADRLGEDNLDVIEDIGWKRVVWYDACIFGPASRSRMRMDIEARMTKHIDTQQ